MAVTRIKNNQITDLTVNAAAKLQDFSITSGKIANNLTYGSDLTVAGNLTVQGNVTAIDTIDLVVEDPLILLAKEQTGSPTLDIGFIGKRGVDENIAFVWDESQDQFVTIFTSSEVTNTNVSINSYASLQVLDITASNATITGNVTFSGNIIGDLSVTGNVTGGNLNSNAAVTGVTVSASGNLEGNNAVVTNGVSAATVSASGNITAGNVNSDAAVTGVTISASGNVEGNNAVITNGMFAASASVTGNVLADNLNANAAITGDTVFASTITASGNLNGNNAVVTNGVSAATVSASGNVLAGNVNSNAAVTGVTVTASGNLEGNNAVITNGVSAATVSASGNVLAGNVNSNAAVTGVTVTASGNLEGNNAVITNDVSAATVSASGNVLAGNVNSNAAVTGVTLTASGNVNANNAVVTNGVSAATVSASGNVSGGNINATDSVVATTVEATGNLVGGNANITSGVFAATGEFTGNVSADYFIGDGSLLTGIDATQIQNGNSNVRIAQADGNITVGVTGVSNVVVFTSAGVDVTGEVNATGNVLAANVNANGAITAASASVTGNVDSGNINVTNGVYAASGSYTGNILADNLTSNAAVTGVTVTATGNLVGGNANITAGVFAADVTATGNVNGGNINSNSIVGSEITVTGANVAFALTGNIDLGQRWINDLADPVLAYDAATKQYVDDAVSSGITIHPPVLVESPDTAGSLNATYTQGGSTHTVTDITANSVVKFSATHNLSVNDLIYWSTSFNGISANVGYMVYSVPNADEITLTATYNGAEIDTLINGTGLNQTGRANPGIDATLTNAGTLETLVIDGVTLSNGDRVLIYNQTNGYENGVYEVIEAGNVATPWVLSRAADMDMYIPNDISGVDAGDYFFVQSGDTGAGEAYVMTGPTGVVILGYSNLIFTQFSSSSIYSAGNGLSLNGTVFSVNVDNDTTAIVADTVVVKAGANLVTPNIGDATGNSLTLSGNGLLSATTVTATGNVSGGNLNATTGVYSTTVSASGNVLAGNVNSNAAVTGVTLTASGNLEGNNAVVTNGVSAATVSASGNVLAGNVNSNAAVTGVTLTASGNINGNNAVVTNDISTATLTASGNVLAGNVNSNAAVTGVTITASGNLAGNNAVITNDVSAATITASGNVLAGNVNSNAAVTGVTLTASGNLSGNNAVITNDVGAATITATGNVSGGNLVTLGNVDGATGYFTGNITAQNFFGNISGNIDAGGANTQIQFNDNDVLNGSAAFTFDSTSNLVTVSGNVSAGNLTTAGDVTTATVTASGNVLAGNVNSNAAVTGVTITASGNLAGNNAVITNDVGAATITASGNVLAGNVNSNAAVTGVTITASGNLEGNNAVITNDVGAATVTATGNVSGGNITTGGEVVATGNVSGGNINSVALVSAATVTATGNVTGGNITTEGQANLGNIRISGDTITGVNGQVLINSAGDDVNLIVSGDTQANLLFVDAGSDSVLISTGTPTTGAAFKVGTSDSILVPVGNSVQRPATPVTGMVRFNTSLDALEFYDSTQWTIAGAEFTIIVADEFVGDNSTVAFTLTEDSTTATTLVSINGVVQIPVTAYSVSGNVLTFTEAPESTDVIDVRILTTTTTVAGINNADNTAAIETPPGGDVVVTGNIIPTGNVTYNLGSATNSWNDLYLAGNTIYLGSLQLKDVGSNTFAVFTSDGTTQANLDVGAIDVSQLNSGTSTIGIAGPNGNAFVTVGGNANVLVVTGTGANIAGTLDASGNITAGNLSVSTGTITTGSIVNANANGVGNIGSATGYFDTVFAKATSAQYADLAEMYEADQIIEPGTVVCFGGAKEVTTCGADACRRVAGVVSTNPSYLMNSGQTGDHVVAVALQGRVPVKVTGIVRKGDMMVAAGDGRARAEANPAVGAVIGKALADFDGQDGVIEVVIGRV